MSDILALGDCNTLGVKDLKGDAYPERFAAALGKSVENCGFTMSTTREMLHFFNAHQDSDQEIILIQYGLVDSWRTFKYAPYVLYYPDNYLRKIARKVVKKYKKTAKRMGLNTLLGVRSVVPIWEYEENLRNILERTKNSQVFLIDTIPHQDQSRNSEIERYNQVLLKLSKTYAHVHYVELYHDFLEQTTYYLDKTHLNHEGYDLSTKMLLTVYHESRNP
jgi:lysophospholipase L1-like esterase